MEHRPLEEGMILLRYRWDPPAAQNSYRVVAPNYLMPSFHGWNTTFHQLCRPSGIPFFSRSNIWVVYKQLQSYTVSKRFRRTRCYDFFDPQQHILFRHLVATCQPHRLWKFNKPMGPFPVPAPGHDCFLRWKFESQRIKSKDHDFE